MVNRLRRNNLCVINVYAIPAFGKHDYTQFGKDMLENGLTISLTLLSIVKYNAKLTGSASSKVMIT